MNFTKSDGCKEGVGAGCAVWTWSSSVRGQPCNAVLRAWDGSSTVPVREPISEWILWLVVMCTSATVRCAVLAWLCWELASELVFGSDLRCKLVCQARLLAAMILVIRRVARIKLTPFVHVDSVSCPTC